jgi:hypothetical protein
MFFRGSHHKCDVYFSFPPSLQRKIAEKYEEIPMILYWIYSVDGQLCG